MTTQTIKTGFHLGVGGNATGVGDGYYKKLAARRVPFVIMSADNFPAEAQDIASSQPDVRHFVGYRRSTKKGESVPPSGDPNVPRYGISAQQASDEHWAWHTSTAVLPSEYNGAVTYLLTINEPNKDDDAYVEWLADVEYYNCQKAIAAGYRYAVFGWAGGNPEPRHWEGPNMTRLLDYIEQHPTRLAVAVHEYSWTADDIWNGFPYLVGRAAYQLLSGRPHLPIVITEFGWAERDAPRDVSRALQEIREVAELYARYPNYLGAALWYLGPNYEPIDSIVNGYIWPLGDYIINNPLEVDMIDDPPTNKPKIVILKLPQEGAAALWPIAAAWAYANYKRTMTASHDDMLTMLAAGNDESKALIVEPNQPSQQMAISMLNQRGYNWEVVEFGTVTPPPPGREVDIRPYFEPSNNTGQFTVFGWLDGSKTQDQQLQKRSDGTIVLVKGNDYERWRFVANGDMKRAEDTSMGGGLAYTQNWARWLPKTVRVGETYTNMVRVTVKRRSDCTSVSDAITADYLTVAALHASWTSPANSALTFADVLEIHWRKTPAGPIEEKYFVAPRFAYVAWGKGTIEAAISEMPQGRPALPWNSWGCG